MHKTRQFIATNHKLFYVRGRVIFFFTFQCSCPLVLSCLISAFGVLRCRSSNVSALPVAIFGGNETSVAALCLSRNDSNGGSVESTHTVRPFLWLTQHSSHFPPSLVCSTHRPTRRPIPALHMGQAVRCSFDSSPVVMDICVWRAVNTVATASVLNSGACIRMIQLHTGKQFKNN